MTPDRRDADLPGYALVERGQMMRGAGLGDEAIGRRVACASSEARSLPTAPW
jgi:hypothetical protein